MTRLKLWALAAAGIIAAFFAAFAAGIFRGKAREERRQLEARVRGAAERVQADTDALRTDDPVGELRARGWMRGVEADSDRSARRTDD